MMEREFLTACVLVLLVTIISAQGAKQKVVMFLLDGLRYDRFGCSDLPGLDGIAESGVRADWMDGVWVSLSAPGMYSLATGLYPESHGVVHNIYYIPETEERYGYTEALDKVEWWDQGAEPIWVTAKLAGLKVGNIMYPGAQTPVKGILPDKVIKNTGGMPLLEKIETAIQWLKEDDMDLITLYTVEIDTTSHIFGTDSNITQEVVRRVDHHVGILMEELEKNGLADFTNVIVVSDHGHKNFERKKVVRLYDYINRLDIEYQMADYAPFFQFRPKPGRLDRVYNNLKNAHPNMHVYLKEDFPERFHWAKNDRVLEIIGYMDPGWASYTDILSKLPIPLPIPLSDFPPFPELFDLRNLTANITWEGDRIFGAQHGYDNQEMTMKPSFYAQGPYFKKGYRAKPLEQVDVYGMMCEILGLQPAPNNGSRERWADMVVAKEVTTPVSEAPSSRQEETTPVTTSQQEPKSVPYINPEKPKVVVFLLDGLRYDRFGCENLPGLDGVAENGVRTDWMDGVWVSLSSPSMFSIATGLYPESHGVVHNIYYIEETGESYGYGEAIDKAEWWDQGAEPFWVTAKKAGLKVGNIMYPGAQTEIKGYIPDKVIKFGEPVGLAERVDTTVKWLLNDDLDLVTLYTVAIDTTSHVFGTDSNITQEVVRRVDQHVKMLMDELEKTGLSEVTNVIIVSDHGHKNFERGKVVRLYDYISRFDIEFQMADYGPFFQFRPKEGRIDRVYNSLKDAHPNMHVYKKEEFPERFHWAKNDRVLPIIGYMDPGWASYTDILSKLPVEPLDHLIHPYVEFPEFPGLPILLNITGNLTLEEGDRIFGAQHGYDNQAMVMKPSFYAQGPFFKSGYRTTPLEQVDIYGIVCEILGLEPAPNNGSRLRWAEIVSEDDDSGSQTNKPANLLLTFGVLLFAFLQRT